MVLKRISPWFLTLVIGGIFAAAPALASPTPILLNERNPDCATLNRSSDPAFAHIGLDWEFKVDPPVTGPVALTGGGLRGGMPATPNISLSMQYTEQGGDKVALTAWSLGWNGPLTRLVTAVIVKGGNGGAYAYTYPTGDTGDTGNFVLPTGQGISHLSFCFDETTAPSAAPVEIAGRVVDARGRGIGNAVVTVVDLTSGQSHRVLTNGFGYYKVGELTVTNLYTVGVRSTRHTFNDPTRTLQLDDNLADLNFVANR